MRVCYAGNANAPLMLFCVTLCGLGQDHRVWKALRSMSGLLKRWRKNSRVCEKRKNFLYSSPGAPNSRPEARCSLSSSSKLKKWDQFSSLTMSEAISVSSDGIVDSVFKFSMSNWNHRLLIQTHDQFGRLRPSWKSPYALSHHQHRAVYLFNRIPWIAQMHAIWSLLRH